MPQNTKHSSELARVETWHSSKKDDDWSRCLFSLFQRVIACLQEPHTCLCLPLWNRLWFISTLPAKSESLFIFECPCVVFWSTKIYYCCNNCCI